MRSNFNQLIKIIHHNRNFNHC